MTGPQFFSVKQLSHSVLKMNLARRRKKLRRKLGKSKQLNLKYLIYRFQYSSATTK